MLDLVAFGRFLGNAAQSSTTFDFSLAIAISGWIRQAVRDAISQSSFSGVVQNAANLEDVISLTSGVAMTEIWSALTNTSSTDVSCVAQLDATDRRLRPTFTDPSTYTIDH